MPRRRKPIKKSLLTEQERWSIISIWKTLKSIRATSKALGHSREVVQRWVRRYEATGGVTPLNKPGRPAIFTPEASEIAKQVFTRPERPSAIEVAIELKATGTLSKIVSKSTVLRHAKAAAKACGEKLKCYYGAPPKALSEDTKQKRLAFAKAHQNTNWSNVMFSDRKRFYFKHPNSSVKRCGMYLQSERKHLKGVYKPSNPNCLNIYAGITMHGATRVCEVAGTTKYKHKYTSKKGTTARNITSGQYIDVLEKVLLPQGKVVFKKGAWMLQQDNDPAHSVAGATIAKWNKKRGHNVQLIAGWPPNSPDLNLIENFWNFIQMDVQKRALPSFEEYKKCVKAAILSKGLRMKKYLANLYASMPRRLAKVIELGGEMTGY